MHRLYMFLLACSTQRWFVSFLAMIWPHSFPIFFYWSQYGLKKRSPFLFLVLIIFKFFFVLDSLMCPLEWIHKFVWWVYPCSFASADGSIWMYTSCSLKNSSRWMFNMIKLLHRYSRFGIVKGHIKKRSLYLTLFFWCFNHLSGWQRSLLNWWVFVQLDISQVLIFFLITHFTV